VTVETALVGVAAKLSSERCSVPADSFAKPVSPLAASATPQPSHGQPGAVPSVPFGR
jgi:hypothetical protein